MTRIENPFLQRGSKIIEALGGEDKVKRWLDPGVGFLGTFAIGFSYSETGIFEKLFKGVDVEELNLQETMSDIKYGLTEPWRENDYRSVSAPIEELRWSSNNILSRRQLFEINKKTDGGLENLDIVDLRLLDKGVSSANEKEVEVMARLDRWRQVKAMWAVDTGRGSFPEEDVITDRQALRELNEQGILDSEAMKKLFPLAVQISGETYAYGRGRKTDNFGRLSLLYVLSGQMARDIGAKDDNWGKPNRTGTIYSEKGQNDREPEVSKAVNLEEKLEILIEQTQIWMERIGWKDPEKWFRPSMKLLKEIFEIGGDNWKDKNLNTRGVIGKWLKWTVTGKLLKQTERLIFTGAAETRFYDQLTREGENVCEKQRTETGGVTIINGKPEHLLIDGFKKRCERLGVIKTAVDEMISGDDGYGFNKRKYLEKIVETLINYADWNQWGEAIEQRGLSELFQSEIVESSKNLEEMIICCLEQAVIIGESQVNFQIISEETKNRAGQVMAVLGIFKEIKDKPSNSYGIGDIGSDWNKILEGLQEISSDELEIKGNNVVLVPGIPQVNLGGNGQGKSCLQVMTVGGLLNPTWAVAKSMIHKRDLELQTALDITEIEGVKGLHWARALGKSSFMIEIERMIESLNNDQWKVDSLTMWDEYWRKTDQLNGMAMTMLALVLIGESDGMAMLNSHMNGLNRIAGPLLKKLEIDVDWKIMDNFKVKEIDEKKVVKSNAFENCSRFLPREIGKIWAKIHGVDEEKHEFDEEYIERGRDNLKQENLKQMGWIEEDDWGGLKWTEISNGYWD